MRRESASWLQKAKIERARERSAVLRARELTEREYELRGNNLAIQQDTSPEILLVGAAGTGKTLAILIKLNRLMWQYAGSRALIVRKVRADLAQSTLVTFERDVLGEDNPICATVQRNSRQSYKYPNGSEIVVGGMDRPGRILSAEYDVIYVAEAVQLELQDWETLVMRNRNGRMPFQQVIADTNPDRPDHWLKQRADSGKTKLLTSYHEDNPRYYSGSEWTEAGQDYVFGKLERLTGVRRDRYRWGKWVLAEGAIYDQWDDGKHLIDADRLPEFVYRFRAIDFGYTNPFVCQWWGVDADGRMYLYREIYRTRTLVEDLAREIKQLSEGEQIRYTVADHDAEDRATLARHGIKTIPAIKQVLRGIQATQERLRIQADGKARLYIVRGCLVSRDVELLTEGKPASTQDEIGGYVWNNHAKKEEPLKADDHGVDALRYAVMSADNPRSAKVHDSNPIFR